MDKIKIKAEERAEQGSAAVRRLRRAGKIPAAVMRMNKGGTLLVKLDAHEFMLGLRGHTSKQLLVTLDMDGKEMPALMREMQNDVVKGTPIHVDFSEVSLTQKVRVVVPISLTGEAVGVTAGRQVHAGDARRVRGGGREGAGGRGHGEARCGPGGGGEPGGHQEGQGRGRRREEGREEVTREGT